MSKCHHFFYSKNCRSICFSKYLLLAENLRYDQFCDKIRELFGADVKNQDLKSIYRKISTNPDAKVDWSEVNDLHFFVFVFLKGT